MIKYYEEIDIVVGTKKEYPTWQAFMCEVSSTIYDWIEWPPVIKTGYERYCVGSHYWAYAEKRGMWHLSAVKCRGGREVWVYDPANEFNEHWRADCPQP